MMQFFSQALNDKLVVALVAAAAGMLRTLLVGALRRGLPVQILHQG